MALITLTSDIGRQDFLTGAVKGQLLQINNQFNIVDISHELSPFNYPQAAYVCRNAIKNFSAKTFHIVMVNLFDKKPDHLLLIEHNDQYIGCADNGLITMILEETPQKITALPLSKSEQKNTLYCAKVFAKAYQDILDGKSFEEIGDTQISIEVKNPLRPLLGEKFIEGQIIFIDNFENVIINITKEEFEEQLDTNPTTPDNYFDKSQINCAECSQLDSVIEHNGYFICMNCLYIEDGVQYCEWCNEGQIGGGDLTYSMLSGCEFCDGRGDGKD